jgi:hypothetical protein
MGTKLFDHVTLTLMFDLLIKNFKGMVSKLTLKFWMCQKCGKMKDYNKK